MNIADIQPEKHYAVRFGMWTLTGRVDAIDKVKNKVVVWTEVGWRPVAASVVLYECKSPEQYAAIMKKRRHEDRTRLRAILAANANHPPRPTPIPPRDDRPIINRQGSVFRSGDYGITREA